MAVFDYKTETTESVVVPMEIVYPDAGDISLVFYLLLKADSYTHSRLVDDLYSKEKNRVVHAADILTKKYKLAEDIIDALGKSD